MMIWNPNNKRRADARLFCCIKAVTLCAVLAFLAGCETVDKAREIIPFLPPSNYVDVGGRKLTRSEVAYYQKIKDLSYATKVNPRDAVAYNAIGELFQKKGNYNLAKELYFKAIDIDDTLSEAHHNLGLICIYDDRFNEGLEHLTKARKLSPDDARIRHHLGLAKAGLSQINEALKEYDEAVALDPEYTPAYLEKSKLLYSLRRYAEAASSCRAALEHIPKEISTQAKERRGSGLIDRFLPTGQEEEAPKTYRQEAAYDLALCLKAQGQIREALGVLIQAEDAGPGRADVQILKAKLQDAAGDSAAALATLQLMRTEFPNMAEVPKRMARLYQKQGRNDLAAKTRLEAAELDHSDRELQEEAARAAEQSKDTARTIAIYERLVRLDPDELRYRRQLAKAYDNAGILRQAAMAYQEIVTRTPEDVATRRRLGMIFAELPGFQGRAELQLKQVLEKNPRDTEVNRRLGELYLQSRNFNEAEKYIRQTLVYAPKDAKALNNLGNLFAGQKRLEDAVDKYKEALAADPSLQIARLNMAKILYGLNRKEELIAPLREYLKEKPLDEEALRLLANSLRDLGRREEAIREYEALNALKPNDVVSSMESAELQKGLGKPKNAIGVYEAILEKHPANADALREAGRLYTEMKMPLRAVFCWQRVLSLNPGDLEAQSRLAVAYKEIGAEDASLKSYEIVGRAGDAEAWKNVAAIRLKRGEKDKAIEAYRDAIKIKPTDIEARRSLCAMLQESNEAEAKEEALKLYQEILQLDPKDTGSHLNLANLYSSANRLADAQEEYDAILRDKPDHTGALVGLGVVWRKRGKYEKALDLYHQALKTEPDLKIAHLNIAIIYDFYMNEPQKAQFHYERYLDLKGDPSKIPEDAPVRAKLNTPAVQKSAKQTSSK